jgi:hypothetical protein
MTEPLNHKLDVSKIKTLTDVKNVFECMSLYSNASEEHEKYELLKEYFTLPNEPQKLELPRKSLEEISQEFDEKIDDLLVKTQRKFAVSKETAEHFYNHKFNKIIENFEHAKKYGSFPLKLTLDYSKLTATGSNITSTFVIKQGNKHEGYYTFGSGYFRYYINKKPNWLVRNCAKIFFDFTWKDV